ncbi:hypothetical protein [Streptomyces sp. NPDC050263]|uniref:hypothetical protein n=1 Tax=Streptomyces sp. NPDC050263 TaxID=3155037 RepID=UPI003432097F
MTRTPTPSSVTSTPTVAWAGRACRTTSVSDSCTTRPTATVTADLGLLAVAAVAALVVTCALPVCAGVRRTGVAVLVTAVLLAAAATGARLTVLQPLDEPRPGRTRSPPATGTCRPAPASPAPTCRPGASRARPR